MTTSGFLHSHKKLMQPFLFLVLTAAIFMVCTAVWAANGMAQTIDWGPMAMGLFGSLYS